MRVMFNIMGLGSLKSIVLAGVAVSLISGSIYIKGRMDGRASVYARLAADKVRILKDGKVIDHEVFSANDNTLCNLIGGCEVSNGGD